MAEGGENEPVGHAVAARGRRRKLDGDEVVRRVAPDDAAGKTHLRHIERDFRAEGGKGLNLDNGAGGRHFMDETFGIDARKDDAALDPRRDAAELAALFLGRAFRRLFEWFGHI